jgi:hypothetical protein
MNTEHRSDARAMTSELKPWSILRQVSWRGTSAHAFRETSASPCTICKRTRKIEAIFEHDSEEGSSDQASKIASSDSLRIENWSWALRMPGCLWARETRLAEVARDSAIRLRLTLECGCKIVVDLDCIQAFQAEIHHDRLLVY